MVGSGSMGDTEPTLRHEGGAYLSHGGAAAPEEGQTQRQGGFSGSTTQDAIHEQQFHEGTNRISGKRRHSNDCIIDASIKRAMPTTLESQSSPYTISSAIKRFHDWRRPPNMTPNLVPGIYESHHRHLSLPPEDTRAIPNHRPSLARLTPDSNGFAEEKYKKPASSSRSLLAPSSTSVASGWGSEQPWRYGPQATSKQMVDHRVRVMELMAERRQREGRDSHVGKDSG